MGSIRAESGSGVYHAMVRGVAQCTIFYDERDNKRFLGLVRKHMEECGIEMYAWCLMGNHIHLLPRAPTVEALSQFMRIVCSSYAKYFNKRYDRVGHLTQGRFASKPVESDQYLLTVVRYIHQNPIGPRLSRTCDYRWSSYQEYTGKYAPVIVSTDFVLDVIGGLDAFIAFHEKKGEPDGSLDPVLPARALDENEVRAIAHDALGFDPATMKLLTKPERNAGVKALRDIGLSLRQIESVTGIPHSTIANAKKLDTLP